MSLKPPAPPRLCGPCVDRGWAQIPGRNKTCPNCLRIFCPHHLPSPDSIAPDPHVCERTGPRA